MQMKQVMKLLSTFVGLTEKLRELCSKEVLSMLGVAKIVNIQLNQCNGAQYMFDIAKLTASLFSNSIVNDM